MKKTIVGIVNFNTHTDVERLINSACCVFENVEFIVVDCFHSIEARQAIKQLPDITLILEDNIGYGRALNKITTICHDKNFDLLVLCNPDLEFTGKLSPIEEGECVLMPNVWENRKNRNTFLTVLQSKFLFLHKLSIKLDSILIFHSVILLIKLLGGLKSRPWAVHGSVFMLHKHCPKEMIFNNATFLYSEELEFAKYCEVNSLDILPIDFDIIHHAHAATKNTTKKRNHFFNLWKSGFMNFWIRWYG